MEIFCIDLSSSGIDLIYTSQPNFAMECELCHEDFSFGIRSV